MNKTQQLDFLIHYLDQQAEIPQRSLASQELDDKWRLFRSLVNVREPVPVDNKFLSVQDNLLRSLIAENGITDVDSLEPLRNNLYLWRGDITTLKIGAIVNAANSALLGCFAPCHACIDNTIHTFAGVQLRLECAEIMRLQAQQKFLPHFTCRVNIFYTL